MRPRRYRRSHAQISPNRELCPKTGPRAKVYNGADHQAREGVVLWSTNAALRQSLHRAPRLLRPRTDLHHSRRLPAPRHYDLMRRRTSRRHAPRHPYAARMPGKTHSQVCNRRRPGPAPSSQTYARTEPQWHLATRPLVSLHIVLPVADTCRNATLPHRHRPVRTLSVGG